MPKAVPYRDPVLDVDWVLLTIQYDPAYAAWSDQDQVEQVILPIGDARQYRDDSQATPGAVIDWSFAPPPDAVLPYLAELNPNIGPVFSCDKHGWVQVKYWIERGFAGGPVYGETWDCGCNVIDESGDIAAAK